MRASSAEKLQLNTQAPGAGSAGKPGGIVRRLSRDKAGSVGVIFGLVVIPLTAFIGLAVAMGESFATPGRPTLAGDLMCLTAAVR